MSAEINNASVNGQAEQRPPRARVDAQRGREQILRAATELFIEQGPEVGLDTIARRAGVDVATLKDGFPRREDLYREVSLDSFAKMVSAARIATDAEHDPLRALRRFMHVALDLRAGAALPALGPYVPISALLERNRNDSADVVDALLRRAQEEGLVRPDVVFGDVALMIIRLSRPLIGGSFPIDDDLAHRQLDIYVDGLRTAAADSGTRLGGPAVDAASFKRLRERMTGEAGDD